MSYEINRQKFLSDSERAELMRVLEMRKDKDRKQVTLLYLLLFTGARASEALNVRKMDLNQSEKTVFIRGLKGSRDREIPVPAWLFERLNVEAGQAEGELIFNIGYNWLREIWAAFRPVKKKLHSLRHTFALQLYLKEKDLRLVQLALGHKSISNTMVYLDFVYSTQQMERIRTAI